MQHNVQYGIPISPWHSKWGVGLSVIEDYYLLQSFLLCGGSPVGLKGGPPWKCQDFGKSSAGFLQPGPRPYPSLHWTCEEELEGVAFVDFLHKQRSKEQYEVGNDSWKLTGPTDSIECFPEPGRRAKSKRCCRCLARVCVVEAYLPLSKLFFVIWKKFQY